MKSFITLVLFSCLAQHCLAQRDTVSVTDQKIIAKIRELKSNKIDTLLSYYVFCNGRPPKIAANDTCYAYDIEYLFWSDKGKCLMQKFDECREYQVKQIDTSLRNLISHNYQKLISAEIKRFEYTKLVNGKKVSYAIDYDHSCYSTFQLYINGKILKKQFDNFDLNSEYDGKHLNRNYKYNQQSVLNTLSRIVENNIKLYNQ